jgi:hypothetical protein
MIVTDNVECAILHLCDVGDASRYFRDASDLSRSH